MYAATVAIKTMPPANALAMVRCAISAAITQGHIARFCPSNDPNSTESQQARNQGNNNSNNFNARNVGGTSNNNNNRQKIEDWPAFE